MVIDVNRTGSLPSQLVDKVVVAIRDADLGLNPVKEGIAVRVPVPKLTKEYRVSLVKKAAASREAALGQIRNVRRDWIKDLKKVDEISKDDVRRFEKQIQGITDEHAKQIGDIFKAKEKELQGK